MPDIYIDYPKYSGRGRPKTDPKEILAAVRACAGRAQGHGDTVIYASAITEIRGHSRHPESRAALAARLRFT